jgi:hypothetical protein
MPLKPIFGAVAITGIIFQVIDKLTAPQFIVTSQSYIAPEWVGWAAIAVPAVATVGYFIVDFREAQRRRP